jgi:mannose-6-phosphate isomerase
MITSVATQPWSLLPNRVSRFYRGGLLLERFRGESAAADSDRPEDWIGSATTAWTAPGAPRTDEGLGAADVAGRRHRIADLLSADPRSIGGELTTIAGPTLGVLVKLLDAGIRLPVHAHPTRAFARAHLGSFFGKAEAWIVLETRAISGEPPPHIRLGFRRGVERDELRGWIEAERGDTLLDAMHSRPAVPGDVWFVPPGTPHAIGAGVFILEVQEPADFSIVAETGGFPIDRDDAHLRLGWDVTIDAFDRRALNDAALDRLRTAMPAEMDGATSRQTLLGPAARPFFRAERWVVTGSFEPGLDPAFVVGVVTAGEGVVRTSGGELAVRRGSTFGVPAAAASTLSIEAPDRLTVIACRAPEPADVARAEES